MPSSRQVRAAPGKGARNECLLREIEPAFYPGIRPLRSEHSSPCKQHAAGNQPLPLPAGQLVEVRFAELERDPLGTLCSIYSSLSLGGFDSMQPLFERYIGGLEMSGFRKNAHRWAGRQAPWVMVRQGPVQEAGRPWLLSGPRLACFCTAFHQLLSRIDPDTPTLTGA